MDLITDFFLSKVLIFAIVIVAGLLAYLVFKDNPKGKINRIYLLVTLLMICWVGFAYIPRVYGLQNYLLGFVSLKIAWFVTPPFFSLLYLLTIYLIGKEKEYARLSKIVLGCGIILALIIGFSDWVIVDYQFVGKIVRVIYGPLMLPFLGVVAFIMGATVMPIIKNRTLLADKRLQLFLIGLFTFYFLNIVFNIFLPIFFDISRFYFLGDYSTLILLGFTAYAIVQHRLFDVRVLLTEAGVAIVIIILLTDTLTSETPPEWLTKGVMLVLVSWGGYLLISSVRKEIAQREQLQVLAQQLQYANERLKRMDAMKTEFVSMASHELLTPISAIEGYLSMMLDEKIVRIDDPKAQQYMDRVYQSSKRLARLVGDLLNVSRIEEGRLLIEKSEVNLEELINTVLNELKFKAEKAKLKFSQDITVPAEQLKTYIDADKIKEALINLCGNAIKFTRAGGSITVGVEIWPNEKLKKAYFTMQATIEKDPKAKLEGALRSVVHEKYQQLVGDQQLVVSVKDTGVGITKEGLSRLFQKFVRLDSAPAEKIPGSGLGLYISRALVEINHGRIWAESEGENKGSTFYFSLPLATPEEIKQLDSQVPQAKDAKPLARMGEQITGRISPGDRSPISTEKGPQNLPDNQKEKND